MMQKVLNDSNVKIDNMSIEELKEYRNALRNDPTVDRNILFKVNRTITMRMLYRHKHR